ncbi:Gamma-aminobutyric acid (GABA) B receptor [Seminavis robusta]|uniref:Gamma-aminobutyric acid (GABA) B receptor n=1 Tax=Seminavis robusta TaxID=568900 RepID=A0A9N8DCK3_9STRA|nr:Gamma-aminobutyric acid (GABA) B receptor [Seminavis robusta]|eukprot:Sro85_g045150.1 Gamma-aminobutyric acid (GABA) B receptor (864) ;mRNA; r:12667-15770
MMERNTDSRLFSRCAGTSQGLWLLALFWALVLTPVGSERLRGENGEISLAITVPLTNKGEHQPNPGWVYMAAALLAVDHFNDKDPAVIKELGQPELADCPFKFVNVSVVDTGTESHMATKSLLQRIQDVGPVDAIAGPYNNQPALELSVLATGMESPIVAFRGLDQSLVLPDKHPFFSQVYPDLNGDMEFVGKFLAYTNRTDYIAILYSNEDTVLQRVEVLRQILRQMGIYNVLTFSYLGVEKSEEGEDRGVDDAVRRISQTGYRTIIVMMTNPVVDFELLAPAAHKYELDIGGHFFIMVGGLDPSSSGKDDVLVHYRYRPEGRLLQGMAFLYIWDNEYVDSDGDFQRTIRQQNNSFFQRMVDLNPVPNYSRSLYEILCEVDSDQCDPANFSIGSLLQVPDLPDQVGFAYDATMAIGIGACRAIANTTDSKSTAMTGEQHLEGIQSVDFSGITGKVEFQNRPATPGSRKGSSIYYGVLNLNRRDANDSDLAEGTSYLDPFTQEWVEYLPFEYAGGSSTPPKLLRSHPEQNFLDPAVRAIGLALMSLSLAAVFASVVWVMANRSHIVVTAAQPPFLYVLCLGAALTSMIVLTQSFDESYGWEESMLSRACLAMPWLACLGVMVTYSALFTKLWRVNKVLQFKRRQIKASQVMWPALSLFVIAVVLLSAWTATTDFGWVREEIDELSGESIGRCTGTNTAKLLIPVDLLVLIPVVLAGVMAWKTSDVDDMYSESKWIFSLILVQLQVFIVGAPLIVILNDVSTTGRYIGLALVVCTFPLSTMGLIFVPKALAVRKASRGGNREETMRGSSPGVRVTGVNLPSGEVASTKGVDSGDQSTRTSRDTSNPTSTDHRASSTRIQTVTME